MTPQLGIYEEYKLDLKGYLSKHTHTHSHTHAHAHSVGGEIVRWVNLE